MNVWMEKGREGGENTLVIIVDSDDPHHDDGLM